MYKPKLLIVCFILILFSSVSMGQPTIGLTAGLNTSKFYGDAPDDARYTNLMGANLGAFIDAKLAHGIYLSFQPSYAQEGTNVSYMVPGKDESVDSIKIRLNYFSLPVLLKVISTNQRFYALAGVETAMLLNSSATIGGQKGEIDTEISQWNFAMHFGAGIRIPVGIPRLFVEMRYTQGLVNITNEQVNNSYIPRVKSSGLKIVAGIEIPLRKSNN